MYNAVGQFCVKSTVIILLSAFTHTQNAPVELRMKKILNKFHHRALCTNHDIFLVILLRRNIILNIE